MPNHTLRFPNSPSGLDLTSPVGCSRRTPSAGQRKSRRTETLHSKPGSGRDEWVWLLCHPTHTHTTHPPNTHHTHKQHIKQASITHRKPTRNSSAASHTDQPRTPPNTHSPRTTLNSRSHEMPFKQAKYASSAQAKARATRPSQSQPQSQPNAAVTHCD